VKYLTELEKFRGKNALGRDANHYRQRFTVEQSDVGTKRDHYLGHNRPAKEFTQQDVGRQIEVQSDGGGWTCWNFAPVGR
jgi:hypothetical protein